MLIAASCALALVALLLWPATAPPASTRDAPGVTSARASTPRRHRRRAVALECALAELVAVLAAPLRAGVAPSLALAAAEPAFREDVLLGPLLTELGRAAAAGDSVAEVWLLHASRVGSADLRFVGQAWGLSERTGAPLADALTSAEDVLRARARGRERLASAAAGPRASMGVLCLLPLSGPLVGAAFGMGPVELYLSSWVASGSVAAGVVLGSLAYLWSRRILSSAA